MPTANQLTHKILSYLRIPVFITFYFYLPLSGSGYVYSSESNLTSIHRMQNIRIEDRESINQKILNKINTYEKLSKDLKNKREIKKQLEAEKLRLLEALIFGQDSLKTNLAQRTNIIRKNLDIIYKFIEKDYPIKKLERLKTIKNLQTELKKSVLSPSLMEEFYNILHNEIELSQEDQVRTEIITIFDDDIKVVAFNIGRIGYYFINEDKKLAGIFSPNLQEWKLVDFEVYADNFKEAIYTIKNTLSARYIILPVEVSSNANVE